MYLKISSITNPKTRLLVFLSRLGIDSAFEEVIGLLVIDQTVGKVTTIGKLLEDEK